MITNKYVFGWSFSCETASPFSPTRRGGCCPARTAVLPHPRTVGTRGQRHVGSGNFLSVRDRGLSVEFSDTVARTDRKWNRGVLSVSGTVKVSFPDRTKRILILVTRNLHPLAVFSAVSPPVPDYSPYHPPWRNGRKSIDPTERWPRPGRTAVRVGHPKPAP